MASQTEIANRALLKLGAETVTAITDDVPSAIVILALWDTVRKSELSKRYWNFALTRVSLPALSTAPAFQFKAAYQLPTNFLKLVQVGDIYVAPGLADYRDYDDSPYAIEGQTILTDLGSPLRLRYVQNVTDTGLFDTLFVEALASKLAYEACYKINQSRQGQETAMSDYKMAVKEAALSNAVARPPQGIPDDSWMLGAL